MLRNLEILHISSIEKERVAIPDNHARNRVLTHDAKNAKRAGSLIESIFNVHVMSL